MPASVEILTKTHEFFRTNVSILVTLTLSFGPDGAASVRLGVNSHRGRTSARGAEKSSKQGATIYL